MAVLLNVDLGELADEHEELYRLAHLANLACGGHAGDAASLDRALALAKAAGTRVGAHPSYPDRAGFGRRALALPIDALTASIREQCALLRDRAEHAGVAVGHFKAHGALYHALDRDDGLAEACLESAVRVLGPVELLGPPGGALERVARALGLVLRREGFADRRSTLDGSLVPRGQPGAVIEDPAEAAAQALALACTGRYETLCVHGDAAAALSVARAVRAAIDRSGAA